MDLSTMTSPLPQQAGHMQPCWPTATDTLGRPGWKAGPVQRDTCAQQSPACAAGVFWASVMRSAANGSSRGSMN